jgi:hypothetical protein
MATAISVTLVLAPFTAALAGTGQATKKPVSVSALKLSCGGEYGTPDITINKPVTINKPITVNNSIVIDKSINIFKPTVINKGINVYKPITINKNIDNSKNIEINKSIDNSKYININKKIIINKGGSADASAMASAMAIAVATAAASASANATLNNQISINIANNSSASAGAGAGAATIIYAGGSYETITVNNYGSFDKLDVSAAAKKCVYQEATVVKAIHAVCVSAGGREFAASHMLANTWIDAAYEGEVARCIAGSTLKVTIGQVVQSDQGMATTYGNGVVLMCGAREAVRHYKDGLLKCAPAVAVPDCTERTNLRLYGTGDMFFSYRTQVCTEIFRSASSSESYSREEDTHAGSDIEIENLSLSGGVGGGY